MFRAAIDKSKPIRIDFRRNYWDAQVQKLVEHGFSRRAIVEQTGLSGGQVARRMRAIGGVRAYRDGHTAKAQSTMHKLDVMLSQCRSLRRSTDEIRRHRYEKV